MLAERFLTAAVKGLTKRHLVLAPTEERTLPPAHPGEKYMLYLHIPFCQVLCPYCSFNRYPFHETIARPYFKSLRTEMLMLEKLGYDFESIYVGGGTPTIMIDELCETLDLAREHFNIKEVAVETNPNHLTEPYLGQLHGRVQRLSVGVQSFDDGLLKQMDRYRKYGSGEQIFERIGEAASQFDLLNVDMIFNFPSQTEDILRADLEKIALCGAQQVTFSPLYVSNGTKNKMAAQLGRVDYQREERFYHIIDETLTEGENPLFRRSTLWTFTRLGGVGQSNADKGVSSDSTSKLASACIPGAKISVQAADENSAGTTASLENTKATNASGGMIEEYQTNYDDYPAIGSGSITHLGGALYVNTFSISEYNEKIAAGDMPLMGKSTICKNDLMRYRFLLDLYKLRLDKHRFAREFGVSIEKGLPFEMAFMRINGAFATDNADELTLTPRGRYLVTVLYRQFLSGMNNLREQAREALPGTEKKLLFGDENYCCAG